MASSAIFFSCNFCRQGDVSAEAATSAEEGFCAAEPEALALPADKLRTADCAAAEGMTKAALLFSTIRPSIFAETTAAQTKLLIAMEIFFPMTLFCPRSAKLIRI
ncbi:MULTISPECIES: hypothetical protein [Novosphingobium]|uniref:hypothetical protein n=1 Tax=Novosphingobium TaxID=165696 RepID=UPI0011AB3B6B|nr:MULTISPECIES: hypothetical protein [Novosphingobium]